MEQKKKPLHAVFCDLQDRGASSYISRVEALQEDVLTLGLKEDGMLFVQEALTSMAQHLSAQSQGAERPLPPQVGFLVEEVLIFYGCGHGCTENVKDFLKRLKACAVGMTAFVDDMPSASTAMKQNFNV